MWLTIPRSLNTWKNFILYMILFLLPFHTVTILWHEKLGAYGEDLGFIWQYGVVGIYFFDVLTTLLIGISCLSFCIRVFQKRFSVNKLYFDVISIVLFLLGIAVLVSIALASQKVVALVYGVRFFEALFLFQAIRTSTLSVSRCAWVFVGAGALQGTLATWQFFAQHIQASSLLGIAYHSPQELGDSVVAYGQYRWLRAYGSFPHPNFLASFLALSFAGCWYLIRTVQEKWQLWAVLFCAISISSGFFLTFSRNAWIGMAGMVIIGGVFLLVTKEKKDAQKGSKIKQIRPWILCALVVACVWTAFSFMFFEIVTTRLGIGGWQKLEQRSLHERRTSLYEGFELLKQHPLGVGLGNITVALFEKDKQKGISQPVFFYQPIHSSYLLVAAELGVGGFMVFIVLLIILCVRIGKGIYKSSSTISKELLLYASGLILFLLWNLMFDHFFISHASGIILLGFCLGFVYKLTALINEC